MGRQEEFSRNVRGIAQLGDFETRGGGCYNADEMDERLKPLSEEAIRQNLKTEFIGRKLVYYERIGSTNDIARELAESGEPEGTVVIADEQVAGRGRFGRTWIAPPYSSLLVSIILRPALRPAQIARVTMAVALGACEGIVADTGMDTRIKWPNDILLNGKKCAGVLSEANTTDERIEYAVCGLGVNVNFSAAAGGIPEDATTLADEAGKHLRREPLFVAIMTAIEQYYVRLKNGGTLHADWAARLATLKHSIRARTPWGDEAGIAEAVDEDGALVLRRADGSSVRLVSADVTLLPRRVVDE